MKIPIRIPIRIPIGRKQDETKDGSAPYPSQPAIIPDTPVPPPVPPPEYFPGSLDPDDPNALPNPGPDNTSSKGAAQSENVDQCANGTMPKNVRQRPAGKTGPAAGKSGKNTRNTARRRAARSCKSTRSGIY